MKSIVLALAILVCSSCAGRKVIIQEQETPFEVEPQIDYGFIPDTTMVLK